MASKELIEKVAQIAKQYGSFSYGHGVEECATEILTTILAALQEPTEGMLEAGYAWDEHVTATETHPRNRGLWRSMLPASALGEQSE